jgi:pyruvate dehydrogenase E2 component (dihydrolipoamide acetyltransferase)
MTEGRLAVWRKREGDTVAPGDVLAEIETDKATMELEAADSGTLGKIMVPAGSAGVKVNDVIAMILEEGEDASSLAKAPPAKKASPAPLAPTVPVQTKAAEAAPAPRSNGGTRLFVSPLARRLAREAGVDLHAIKGSGPGGRIVQRDVAGVPKVAAPAAPLAEAGTLVPHSNIRRITGERLTEAWRTIPHIYLTADCVIDELMRARASLNERGGDHYKLSVNDFVIRAVAFALRKVPEMNAQYSATGTVQLASVDVSVAVALKNGLITPIIRHADQKGLIEISTEMRALADKAKAGKLMPEEYQGGGFSISNLGMYGVTQFNAIVNPPQAGILAVGAGETRAIVRNGAVVPAMVMTCTLSCDHRVVDGAVGARFLAAVRGLLEEPMTMLL